MPTQELVMPRMSDTMEQGTVIQWSKRVGDIVAIGEVVVEIETDKAVVGVEAEHEAVLHQILVGDGQSADVGSVIAVLAWGDDALKPAENSYPDAQPDAGTEPMESGTLLGSDGEDYGASDAPPSIDIDASDRNTTEPETVTSSPLARRLATRHGLDIATLFPGSGPHGRVIRTDIERASTQVNNETPGAGSSFKDELIKPSRIKSITAVRLTEAKQQIPHFYLCKYASMDALLRLREQPANLQLPRQVSVTDMVIKACGLALRQFPAINASWTAEGILRRAAVNVGVAVGLDDGTLVVPVIHDADKLPLREIAAETVRKIQKAREGTLSPADMQGGTFTLSNLGMFGISEFKAIINPPESAILALGSVEKVPAVQDNVIVIANRVTLWLSADHRVFSGVIGSQFLGCICSYLEEPLGLLV